MIYSFVPCYTFLILLWVGGGHTAALCDAPAVLLSTDPAVRAPRVAQPYSTVPARLYRGYLHSREPSLGTSEGVTEPEEQQELVTMHRKETQPKWSSFFFIWHVSHTLTYAPVS